MWARIGMVAVLAITACYAPTPSVGAPCGPGELCPAGLTCSSQNTCVLGDELPDASSFDAPGDTPPPDVLRKRWSLVATAGNLGTIADVMPTQLGNTLLVGVETAAVGSVMTVMDTAGNTFEKVPASRAVNTGTNAVEVWIASDIKDGATKVIASGIAIGSIVVWEVANLAPQAPIVDVGTLDTQPATTSPSGVAMELTERGQFMLSVILVANSVNAITSPEFTNDQTTFGNGWAHLTDDDAAPGTYQATWNQPMPGTSCATSVVLRVAD